MASRRSSKRDSIWGQDQDQGQGRGQRQDRDQDQALPLQLLPGAARASIAGPERRSITTSEGSYIRRKSNSHGQQSGSRRNSGTENVPSQSDTNENVPEESALERRRTSRAASVAISLPPQPAWRQPPTTLRRLSLFTSSPNASGSASPSPSIGPSTGPAAGPGPDSSPSPSAQRVSDTSVLDDRSNSKRRSRASLPHARGPPLAEKREPPPLPARSFYAPGGSASTASLARVLQRACLPGVNALFPMFPARHLIAAGRGTRVELHAHLVGSVRYSTLWELMRARHMVMPGDGSVRAMREALVAREPMNMLQFLEPVSFYMEAFVGDMVALERIAYEFCEDKVEQGVLYVEARYAPQTLIHSKLGTKKNLHDLGVVVMAINRGFRLAEVELGIVVRAILAIVVGIGSCNDVVNLCQQFQNDGVVGIDLHLPYHGTRKENEVWIPGFEEVPLSRDEVRAFQAAQDAGVHRTVHAGQLGSAYMVQRALDKYSAQRIGHGYEVLKLPAVYHKCRERNVHFECCPWVSLLTGAVDLGAAKHPIAQFAEDGVNFSLSTSHPTITGLALQAEYDLATSWGLTEVHLVRANINALRCSFLQPAEKAQLMQTLLENIGIKRRGGAAH